MQIIVNYDQNVTTLPNGFVSAINYVVSYYDSIFTNSATITIDVGYGEIGAQFGYGGAPGVGAPVSGSDLGESASVYDGEVGGLYVPTYTKLRNAILAQNAPGAYTLPANPPPDSPSILAISAADAIALNLTPDTNDVVGVVGFSSTQNIFSYAPNAPLADDETYFIGVVEHEFSEVLGRTSLLNGVTEDGATTPAYSLMDLFRYSAPGVRDFVVPAPTPYDTAYFSIDGGSTPLDDWNTNPGTSSDSLDLGDWAPSAGDDAFDDSAPPGVINEVSPADLTLMNALGWDVAASWGDAVSGDFATGANWNTGFAPNSTIGAIIAASGTYTVTSSQDETVGSLSTIATATLDITGGTFIVTGALSNHGNLDVNGGTLVLQDDAAGGTATVKGAGTLEFAAGSNVNVTFSTSANTYTTIGGSLGVYDFTNGINNNGEIVGSYATTVNGQNNGFLYSNGTYTDIDNPLGAPLGTLSNINDSGEIVGYYSPGNVLVNGLFSEFLYSNGTYTTISDPLAYKTGSSSDATYTIAYAINDSGAIVGYYEDADNATHDHGFLYSNGTYTTIDDALGASNGGTEATGINDSGAIIGSYQGSDNQEHGFLYSNGTYTTLNDPLADDGTELQGINNAGQIFGNYIGSNDVNPGFLYSNGIYTTINDPLGTAIVLAGMNDSGEIVGSYEDSNFKWHGFLYNNGTYTTIDDPLGTFGTHLTGINDAGEILGYYVETNGTQYGFITDAPNILKFDDVSDYSGTISGFVPGDTIDLTSVGYDSSGSADLNLANNQLVITENSQTYDLQLDQTQSFVGEAFSVSSDGIGGTYLASSRSPLTSSAVVSSGQTASNVEVGTGGDLIVASGATASGTIVDTGGTETVSAGGTDIGATVNSDGVENVYGSASATSIDNGATVTVYDGGTLQGAIVDNGTLIFDLTGSSTFTGTLTGNGSVVVEGGGSVNTSSGITFASYADGVSTYDTGGQLIVQEYAASPGLWYSTVENDYNAGLLTATKYIAAGGQVETDYTGGGPGNWSSQNTVDGAGNIETVFTPPAAFPDSALEIDNATVLATANKDIFVFDGPTAARSNEIVNFDVAHDVLQLTGLASSAAAELSAILADPHNTGNPANTYIALDAYDWITLIGVQPGQLTQQDFQIGQTAQLANYMASSFVASGDGSGGMAAVDPLVPSSGQAPFLTQPHK